VSTDNRVLLTVVALASLSLGSAVTFGFERLNAPKPIIISDAVAAVPSPPIVQPSAASLSNDETATPSGTAAQAVDSGSTGSKTHRKTGRGGHHKITSGVIHINSATIDELEELPGVGLSTAQAIVDYRTQTGGFQSVDDLGDIPRMGKKKLEKLMPYVAL
jgi:competence protein ComEA